MKPLACLLAGLMLVGTLSACGAPAAESPSVEPSATPSVEPSESPSPTPVPFTNPLTGEPTETDLSANKPVAIMMNNIKDALPQQGNSQADIIYEVIAEGGITRMVALFQDPSELTIVGSVRSARPYFMELAMGHDAVYVHAGGSDQFYSLAQSLGLTTVDGVKGAYSGSGIYYRDRERIAGKYYAYEHSLLVDAEKMREILTQDGLLTTHKDGYTYEMSFAQDGTPKDGTSATTVTVPFSGYKTGVFRYDSASGTYLVEEYGQPYVDGNTNEQVAVTNVLVVQAPHSVMSDGYHMSVNLTSGSGYYACGGKIIPITWEKGKYNQQLRYYTADGQPLTLGVGSSYVCVIPTDRTVTAE